VGVASDYRALARRVRSLPEEMVRAGAADMQQAILANLKGDTGGDQALSGTSRGRRRRTKLATTVTVTGGTALATATVKASPPKALGQWGWLEQGTSGREMGKLHMLVGGAWRTGPWTSSGSPAKSTFTNGVAKGTPIAERAMTALWERAQG
jgi:hypothetical protein